MPFSQQLPNTLPSPYHEALSNLAHTYFSILIFYNFILWKLHSNPRDFLAFLPRTLKPSILSFSHFLFPLSGKLFALLFTGLTLFIQVSAQIPSSQRGLPWSHYLKQPRFVAITLSSYPALSFLTVRIAICKYITYSFTLCLPNRIQVSWEEKLFILLTAVFQELRTAFISHSNLYWINEWIH